MASHSYWMRRILKPPLLTPEVPTSPEKEEHQLDGGWVEGSRRHKAQFTAELSHGGRMGPVLWPLSLEVAQKRLGEGVRSQNSSTPENPEAQRVEPL